MRKKEIMLNYKRVFKRLKELDSAKDGLKLGIELSKEFETVHVGDKTFIVSDEDKDCFGCIQIQPECHFFDFTGTLNQNLREQIRQEAYEARAAHTPEERYQESRKRVAAILKSVKAASKVSVVRG